VASPEQFYEIFYNYRIAYVGRTMSTWCVEWMFE